MRWTKVVALATAGTLSLAACGGGGSSDDKSTKAGAPPVAEDVYQKVPASAGFDPAAKGPATEIPGAKKGGTLRFSASTVPESTDPSSQYYQDTHAIMRLTNRSLTQYKILPDGKSVLVPDLATDLGKASPDGLKWVYTLKPGLKYEDGSAIKASDIAYSVKRAFASEELPGGPTFQNEYLKDGDKYKGPWKSGETYAGVSTDDAKGTITFNMAKPMATFPYFASFTMFGPIPKAKDTKTNYQLHWVSTGPYKIKSYTKGTKLILDRNPNWDAASDPSRHQYPDTIEFSFGRDQTTTARAIMADNGPDKETVSYDGVDPSILAQVLGPKSKQVATGPSPCTQWPGMTMDTTKIPFEVRKAIAAAWPIDQTRAALGLTSLDTAPGSTISAPQVPGFTKYTLPGLEGKGKGDPAKAKAMLTAANKLGFEISYYYTNDDDPAKAAEAVRKPALEAAGFKVRSIGVSKTERRKKVRDPKANVNMGQGVGSGWCYDWPGGDSIYPPLFNSTIPINGGVGNVKDKALDKEMADIAALPLAEQGPKWTALDKKILETILPVIPMGYEKAAHIFGTKVHNVVIDPNAGMADFPGIWVG